MLNSAVYKYAEQVEKAWMLIDQFSGYKVPLGVFLRHCLDECPEHIVVCSGTSNNILCQLHATGGNIDLDNIDKGPSPITVSAFNPDERHSCKFSVHPRTEIAILPMTEQGSAGWYTVKLYLPGTDEPFLTSRITLAVKTGSRLYPLFYYPNVES